MDNFAFTHNFADTRGIHDWKLYIDADEKLCSPMSDVHKLCTLGDNEGRYSWDVKIASSDGESYWRHPRIYRRFVDIRWVGAAHPTLNVSERNPCDIKIEYGRSPNHDVDPLRTRRILLKSLSKNPTLTREKFYLGRDYAHNQEWDDAIAWLEKFLNENYLDEYKAEANLLVGKIYRHYNMYCKAGEYFKRATDILPDFKEAWELRFLVTGNGEYREKAEKANNEGVLFVRNRSWLKKHS